MKSLAAYLRSHWLMLTSYTISVAGLVYMVLNLHPAQLKTDLAGVTLWLVVLAMLLDVSPRALQAVRWRYLLRHVKVSYAFLLQAIYVGTLYSGILPLSTGDAVRGIMVARHARAPSTAVFSTELVERLADAAAVILVVWFTLRGFALPSALRLTLATLEALIGAALIVGALTALRKGSLSSRLASWHPSGRVTRRVRSVLAGVMNITGSLTVRDLAVSLSTALAIAVLRVGVLWLLLTAYHLHLSFLHAAGLFAIIMIGTFLPNTPGNLGSWQFFCILGLRLYGVSGAQAAGFSLIGFAIWTIPPVLIGAGALVSSPFSWSELRLRDKTGRSAVSA
ncbi:MAG: flippase-like domain-containing protein [Thermoleophilia bacterium]|nr:flippase-like domain-containing protein [Thermoleophilia bacterium]